LPKAASKANAIRQLRNKLGYEKLVVFGDGKNDVDMFELADEAYAVANAVPELKERATAVIGGNNEDGVAKWLEKTQSNGNEIQTGTLYGVPFSCTHKRNSV